MSEARTNQIVGDATGVTDNAKQVTALTMERAKFDQDD